MRQAVVLKSFLIIGVMAAIGGAVMLRTLEDKALGMKVHGQ
jgi:hypothetical protein